ncbi:MAG: nuclear transport factor 2 family protein [Acidobacteria bacterium]|nr:nuclear transport factor 2 family protein [Acidobacteriota bacterium]
MSPLETVQQVYAAFARGDIAAILGHLSEDVAWESWADNSAQKAGVPWMTARTGREAVGEFFSLIARFEIHDFRVLNIMAGERQVAAEFEIDATPPGGKRYRDQEMHLWTFDGEGKICRLRHYLDTAKHIASV